MLQKLFVSVHVRLPGIVASGIQGTGAEVGDEDGCIAGDCELGIVVDGC
jgi:hypothetical protein